VSDDLRDLVLGLLDWSEPEPRVYKGESYSIRTAPITDREFWNVWREEKEEVKALGISVSRDDETGEFSAKWWMKAEEDTVEVKEPELDELVELKSVIDGPYDVGDLDRVLRPHQIPAAVTLAKALGLHGFALDASDTGLGKTFQALGAAKMLGLNVGVVCPANAVTKWEATAIDFFGIELEFVLSYDRCRQGVDPFITRTDTIRRGKDISFYAWNAFEPVTVIFDEAHECAAADSKNARVLLAAIRNRFMRVLPISATAANTPLKMMALGEGLKLHKGTDWWQWCQACGCHPGPFGGLQFRNKPGTQAERALKQIHAHIFPEFGCRVRRSEVLTLAKSEIFAELIDLYDGSDKRVLRLLKEIEEKELDDEQNAIAKEMDVAGFTKNLRARQKCEVRMVPAFVAKTLELLEEGCSVVVFLNFARSIALFEEMLPKNTPIAKLVGGLSRRNRDDVIARFQEDRAHICLAQITAGAASIDLHDTGGHRPRRALHSPTYDSIKFSQAFGRIDRDNPTPTMQWVYFAAGTVMEKVCATIQKKLNNLALINDGDLKGVLQLHL
jgi:hypothetical protein